MNKMNKKRLLLLSALLLIPCLFYLRPVHAQLSCSGGTWGCAVITQLANGTTVVTGSRATDSGPSGFFFVLTNAAGNSTVYSLTTGGVGFFAGGISMNAGNGAAFSPGAADIYGVGAAGSGVLHLRTGTLGDALILNADHTGTFQSGVSVNSASATGTLNVSGTVYHTGLTTEPGTKSALCLDPVTMQMESNAAATCTVSNLDMKNWISDLTCSEASHIIKGMRPAIFKDKDGRDIERMGFAAEWTAKVDPRLVYYDNGKPHAVDYERYTAVLTRALQCRIN